MLQEQNIVRYQIFLNGSCVYDFTGEERSRGNEVRFFLSFSLSPSLILLIFFRFYDNNNADPFSLSLSLSGTHYVCILIESEQARNFGSFVLHSSCLGHEKDTEKLLNTTKQTNYPYVQAHTKENSRECRISSQLFIVNSRSKQHHLQTISSLFLSFPISLSLSLSLSFPSKIYLIRAGRGASKKCSVLAKQRADEDAGSTL